MATRLPQQRIDIGNVMSLGFRTLAGNFLPFAAFALLLVGLPGVLVQYLTWEQVASEEDAVITASYWGTVAVYWITGYLLQGIVVAIAVRDLGGDRPGIGESAARALGRLFPMIAVSIVSGIAILFGFMLLAVPGIILMLMWMVAVPVLIEERRGVFESLGRSAELTRGSKGWIFLLLLLYWGVTWTFSAGIIGLVGYQFGEGDAGSMLLPTIAVTLAQVLGVLLMGVMTAALYVELRHFKEGASPDQLAAIFE